MRGIFPLARRKGGVQVKGDEGGDVHHALLVPQLRGSTGEDFPQEKKDNLNIFFYFFAGQVPFVHSQVPLGAAEVPRGEPGIFRLNNGTSIWRI